MPQRLIAPTSHPWPTSIVVVLALVCSVTACAEKPRSDHAQVVRTDASPQEIRADAAEYVDRWFGTVEQRQAAEILVAHALNGERAACMGEKGFDWRWDQGAMPATPTDPLAATGWFATPHQPPRSPLALAWAEFHRAEAEMNASQMSPEADQAMTECLRTTESASDSQVDAIRSPEPLASIAGSWFDMLAGAAEPFGSRSEYAACMTKQALPLLQGEPFTDRRVHDALVAAQPPDELIPTGEERPSPQWTRFLRVESTVTDADWLCREDVYESGIQTLVPVINDFADQHAGDVDELEKHWQLVEDRARALGWDPTTNTVNQD